LYVYVGLIGIFLLLPIAMVLVLSFNSSRFLEFPPPSWTTAWYRDYFGSADWLSATVHSLEVASVAAVLAAFSGTTAAFVLVRRRFAGRHLVYLAALSPLIVPQIIYAIGVYLFYAPLGLLGTIFGVAMAHAVLGLPFVVLIVMARLQAFDSSTERVAQTLGATPLRAVRTVTLPIIRPALFAGILFAFMTSFDEVVVAIFIASGDAKTLPVRIWESVHLELDPTISAVAALLVIFAVVVLGGATLATSLAQRRMRRTAG
jgi:ABC-type spermidine/putrescine transport system permease subunit II